MKKQDFKYRQLAIEKTLKIESITSFLIKNIIGLALNQETKTLSNKSSSLSLKSKIDLLYDCKKITKEEYSSLLHIISIRNQFAHNYDCQRFEDLPQFISGIDKPLLKYCESPSTDLNANLENGFNKMVEKIMESLKILFDELINDLKRQKRNIKAKHDRIVVKMLNYYGINTKEDIKIFKPHFVKIVDEENNKNEDEPIDDRVHKRILELLKKNGR
ncbi:hypothetical protein [Olleya sp. Hel_I_94]|uniref:hypothetical protein n=1 Tax=Olleya sp. Hel_I_94 TaxID=1250001 RepID=UPI00119D8470|nr:hypothetical protein [Olleya sp. Hel_I_94]TVZ47449.1 hypothetical protein JM82_2056 [Olleya sp. Hel_I_94]